jgi:hypothetical protein
MQEFIHQNQVLKQGRVTVQLKRLNEKKEYSPSFLELKLSRDSEINVKDETNIDPKGEQEAHTILSLSLFSSSSTSNSRL